SCPPGSAGGRRIARQVAGVREVTRESEAALLEGLRGGGAAALGVLMERHAARVYRVALGSTRSAADAEEVVQEVFTSLVRAHGGFEGRSALATWLYRVATNAALARRRGKRAQLEVSLEDCLPTFKDDGHREGDRTFLLADWSPGPDEALLSGE